VEKEIKDSLLDYILGPMLDSWFPPPQSYYRYLSLFLSYRIDLIAVLSAQFSDKLYRIKAIVGHEKRENNSWVLLFL